MPFKDPEKRREYRRKWYSKNKISERNQIRKRRIKIKTWFKDYKNTLKCSKCGEDHPSTIEFHHKYKFSKEKEIGLMVNDGFSIEKIKQEIKKCVILCANCHRKIHYKGD